MEKRVSDQTCIVDFLCLGWLKLRKNGRPKYLIDKVVERNHRPFSKLCYIGSRWYSDIHTGPRSVSWYIMIYYFLIFEEADRGNQEGDFDFDLKIAKSHRHS